METITLPHGQVELPLEICRKLGIETGMRLEVELDEETGCIRIRPVNHSYRFDFPLKTKRKLKQKPHEHKRLK